MDIEKILWETKDAGNLVRYYFGVRLTPLQQKIVRLVAFDDHPRVTICCMTRYGKSFSVSLGILLWIISHPNKRIAVVAPTIQKTSIIRNYLAFFLAQSDFFLSFLDMDRSGSDRIRKEVSKTRMTWKNGVEMRTLSAEGKGEALMGFGADKIIVDETCDINYEVFRSKISRMLGDNAGGTYVEIGNPWHRDNQFWEHWINPDWKQVHIGWKDAQSEGRIQSEFADEQRKLLTDREWKILYEAEFPDTSEDALFDWSWINRASRRTAPVVDRCEVVCGVDVAEHGNDLTVVMIGFKDSLLNNYVVTNIESWGKSDLMPTVGRIIPLLERFGVGVVRVDATGVGSGVYSRLEELRSEGRIKCLVQAFKGGLSPSTDAARERFLNQKAESYWHLRKLFEDDKIVIPAHSLLINQLSKMKWELTSSEKIRIRDPGTKEGDTAEEKSPDFSDALNIMCWAGERAPLIFGNLEIPTRGGSWHVNAKS